MMNVIKLFSLVALISGAIAVPVEKCASALPFLGGVNLAGCEFGIDTGGNAGTPYCPPVSQVAHFIADGANFFRLPVGWQYIVNNNLEATSLSGDTFTQFDALVNAVTSQGAYALIDLRNYARWNGKVIGQGGPTDAQFANVWKLLATKHKGNSKVVFGLMNEPHDLSVSTWANSLQAAVNAIRGAGATSQTILLPGTDYAHPQDYTSGTNNPLLSITDGTSTDKSRLLFDVHQYLDDGSGGSPNCQTDGTGPLQALVTWLSANGRQAMLTETGGGNNQGCITDLGAELAFVKNHKSQLTGFTVWSAGSFDPSYTLSITPTGNTDNALFNGAVKPYLPGSNAAAPARSSSSVKPSTLSPAAVKSTSTKPATSTKPVVTSSAKPVVSSTSTKPAVTSTAAATTSKAAGTTGNLQTFSAALGGVSAPAVTASSNQFKMNSELFKFKTDALNQSCYAQMNACASAANQSGNKGSFTVQGCNTQSQACLSNAQTA